MRLVLLLLLLLASALQAQGFDFYDRGPYRAVPRPDSLLGYAIGSRHTMYHQQQQALDRMIAAAPDRVRTESIGTTAEGRVMRLLVISAPENLARLDGIRADLAALADPRRTTAAQAAAIAERTPSVVLLTHSVHGNEPAGFEASLQTAYQLLASEEPATLEILRDVVVLLNPSQNPDGHERFAAWSNSVAVGTDEPAALEQTEPWSVWGRFNHYRFDLNRDLLAQSQPESRALAAAMARWRPSVVVDLHSTTSQYFSPPVAQAVNQHLPAATLRWYERYGRANGEAFDARGWQYYVRDIFDLFYPGYVDAWPSLRGAVGMTYETDGGPELRKRKDDGTFTTFEEGIARHYVASLATLATAARTRAERHRDGYQFHASGMAEAERRPLRRVIVEARPDPARALGLARLLAREGIEVTRAAQAFTAQRATSYLGSPPGRRVFPAGTYVVDLAQPEARLATAILEPRAAFDSAFVRAQLHRYERNKIRGEGDDREGYEFYDITAWSLPLTLGLTAFWTDETAPVAGEPVRADDALPPVEPPARARSAYVFSNDTEAGARLALHLLGEDVKVAVATQPIVADGTRFPRGSFVVRVQRNADGVHDRVARLARRTGATVHAVQSAFADSGAAGVGSESVVAIRRPRVLLLAGDGVQQTSFGAFWHYLERELEAPLVPVTASALGSMELDRYNVLIIPAGSAERLWRELGEEGAGRLATWVREGGAVIAVGGSVSLLAREELGLTTVRPVGETDPEKKDGAPKDSVRDTTVAPAAQPAPPLVSPTAGAGAKPEFIPGAIFRATLDRTHWLTYGYEAEHLPVFLNTGRLLSRSEKGGNPVAFVGDSLTLAGFTWPNNTEKYLRGSIWAAVESQGRGKVILFADDPLFRAFWRGTARLVTNAILFGPGR